MAEQAETKPGTIEFYGGYQVYSQSGVDLTLLRENLKRPVADRFELNARALGLIDVLRSPAAALSDPFIEVSRDHIVFDAEAMLRRLSDNGVAYVLVGGMAMATHGFHPVTGKIEICYSRTPENLAKLVASLEPLQPSLRGAPSALPFRLDVATLQAGINFALTTTLVDFDLLGEVKGIGPYEKVRAESDEHSVLGLTIRILSLDGLIKAKKADASPKSLLELQELQRLKRTKHKPRK